MADVPLHTRPLQNTPLDAHVLVGDDGTETVTFLLSVLKAYYASSLALTGTPTAPTAAAGTNTTQVATTAHVFAERSNAATLANKTLDAAVALADPSVALGIATKQYVDGIATNLGKRQRVRAATTGPITIATGLNNGDTLDGVTLVTGDLVLVKDQAAPEQNGVYVVGVTPARAAEFDTYDEHPGSLIAVQEGDDNADRLFLCTSNVGGTLNTTGIVFAANSAPTDAASVSVADSGAYFTGTNVETVLQEVGAALAAKVDALAPVTINASTNLTRASHGNRLLICTAGTAINLTIEDDTTGEWEDGDFFAVLVAGAGTVTIQGDGTSAVNAVPGFALTIPQNGVGSGQRSGANTWSAYGQLAVQAQATWEAGAGTTETVISPAKLAAAIAALAPAGGGAAYLSSRTWGMLAQINGSAHVVLAVGTITVMGTGGTASTPWNTDRGWVRVSYTNTGAAANLTAGIRSANGSVDMAPGADARAAPCTFRGSMGTADALTGCRGFLGWRTATNDPGATEPSAFTNFAGIGYDSDMSQYVFMHNDGSGVADEITLNGGTGFPCNSNGTDKILLEMAFTGEGGAQTLHWRVTNEDTGDSDFGTITSNLPASGSLMNAYAIRNSGANTTAPVVHIGDLGGGKMALTDIGA